MSIEYSNYGNYMIVREDSVQHGIFFRNPIQKAFFDMYPYGAVSDKFSACDFAYNISKNPFYKLYQILIGNKNIVKNINKWINECDDFTGFDANILCSPIYFKRKYRKLRAYPNSNNFFKNDIIRSIESYGFESEWESCQGACKIERTKFKLINGKTIHINKKNYYHFTFTHVIKEIIENQEFKDE